MDGQNSCYHGPSFQVYLATGKGFQYSPDFTALAQEYCGMFDVDAKNKIISTMTKSGCCWHQFSEYKVASNSPYPIKIVEEEASPLGITWDYTEENLIKGEMVKSIYQTLAVEISKDDLLLSFEFENKKKMQIFKNDTTLYYAFTDANNKIELLYNEDFKYSDKDNTLTFSNKNTQYMVSDEKIQIKMQNKIIDMKSANNSKTGTLTKLKTLKLENVYNE